MSVLLFFAPIDGDVEVIETSNDSIPEEVEERFGINDDSVYQFLPHVWDVDAEGYCIWRPTLAEACDVAMQRFEQDMRGRYEDALTWNSDVQGATWEEFWAPLADEAQKLIDEVLTVSTTLTA